MDTDDLGIVNGYKDAGGEWHATSEKTRRSIRAAMGVDGQPPRSSSPRTVVLTPNRQTALPGPGSLRLEDGAELRVEASWPKDLPLGYHQWTGHDGQPCRVIVSPGRCFLPERLHTWGWAAQLYATRSSASWGMGDLADLRELSRWSAETFKAGMLLINPIGAAMPFAQQQPSPYSPSSRLFRNLLYLRIEELPDAQQIDNLEELARKGLALNKARQIDRDTVFALKMRALEALFARFRGDAELDLYRAEMGESLHRFAQFNVLAEQHGSGWKRWPEQLRRPESPAVARFAEAHADRIRFHEWVQWHLDRQLAAASRHLALMQDLPIGVDPEGADAWVWQDVLADGVSVGAPPDLYNAAGQDWGLPPLIPHRLPEVGYEPFIQTIRAGLRHAGGLRIDHVMGLFRLYWVPRDGGAREGTYVRYPADDLLGILALESHRAKALVVGEDLGTVEEGTRERLAESRVLSYRVFWFEEEPPKEYPELAMAAVTTHDLPTIAGIWTGADTEEQVELGLPTSPKGADDMKEKLLSAAEVPEEAAVEEAIVQTHEKLIEAPSVLVVATLDDALGVAERPNMPSASSDKRANWSIALPKTLEEMEQDARVRQLAEVMSRRVRAR